MCVCELKLQRMRTETGGRETKINSGVWELRNGIDKFALGIVPY